MQKRLKNGICIFIKQKMVISKMENQRAYISVPVTSLMFTLEIRAQLVAYSRISTTKYCKSRQSSPIPCKTGMLRVPTHPPTQNQSRSII